MTARAALCGLLVALLALPPAAARAAPPPTATYAVQRGDTLYDLSRRWFPAPGAREKVRRLNRIADVHRVLTGRSLVVPRPLLADERAYARIETFSGDVSIQPAAGSSFAARRGAAIGEGAVIRTGRAGFAALRLADDSLVSLPSQSAVRVVRLRRVLMTGAIEREFAAESGRLRAVVTPMTAPGSTFEVRTPLTVAAVRGTRFRVTYDAAASKATTAVEEGRVHFAAAAAPAASAGELIEPGFAAQANTSGAHTPAPLLPAPRLAEPDAPQTGEDLAFALEPVAGAGGYAVSVARDAGLVDLVSETTAPAPAVTLPGLPTGTWFVRVSALDGEGLEGLGRTYSFDRVRNTVAGSMNPSANGFERRYQFRWRAAADGTPQYRFQLAAKADPVNPLVDEPVGTATSLEVTSLPPGEYVWRVLSLVPHAGKVIPAWSGEQGFEVAGRR